MTGLDKKTVEILAAAGVKFVSGVTAPGGQQTVYLEPADLPDFVSDNELWFAMKHGATKEDYLNWVHSEGTPKCGFILKNGRRCRNIVSGGIQRSFLDWLNEEAGLCTVHGGDNSEEAKEKRWKR
ncbi:MULTISPECIES: hypothetical protein [unclassified Phaeobacter]|uniref:hypothetical protein n=1 Tax=unclassified Phaeobacter TaxID=2621772 RepID=UPI003A885157